MNYARRNLLYVFRWAVLSVIVGIITGFAVSAFLNTLEWSTRLSQKTVPYFLLLPLGLLATNLIRRFVSPEDRTFTTSAVIENIFQRKPITPASVFKAFTLPIITLSTGGSLGKEAPAADIGAGLSSILGRWFKISGRDLSMMMICGMCAGFSAVFGTPIAGAFFGLEVLYVKSMLYDVMFPAFVSSLTAYFVTSALGTHYTYHLTALPTGLSGAFSFQILLLGIAAGLFSLFFIEAVNLIRKLNRAGTVWWVIRGPLFGLGMVALAFFLGNRYMGLGTEAIQSLTTGAAGPWYDFLLKTAFVLLTLLAGGEGGIVTPLIFIGAAMGGGFEGLFGKHTGFLAQIGMVSLLAGVLKTPISSSILFIELFGVQNAPYACISCIISYLISGERLFYVTQKRQKQ